jgi:hypothetical protein
MSERACDSEPLSRPVVSPGNSCCTTPPISQSRIPDGFQTLLLSLGNANSLIEDDGKTNVGSSRLARDRIGKPIASDRCEKRVDERREPGAEFRDKTSIMCVPAGASAAQKHGTHHRNDLSRTAGCMI